MQEDIPAKSSYPPGPFGVKKFIIIILILAAGVAGFDYYQKHQTKLASLTQGGLDKISQITDSAKKEI